MHVTGASTSTHEGGGWSSSERTGALLDLKSETKVVDVEVEAARAPPTAASSAHIAAAAAAPASTSRHARTTRAPPSASARAVSYPMPLLPPVTIAVRPAQVQGAARLGSSRGF